MMNSDFTHGWSSFNTGRMYRIEVNMALTSDLLYIFSVDGVSYLDFPQKSAVRTLNTSSSNNGRYADEHVSETTHTRRASTGAVITGNSSHNSGNNRINTSNHGTSNNNNHNRKSSTTSGGGFSSSDPFAATNDTFDPFADDFGSNTSNHSSGNNTNNNNTKTPNRSAGPTKSLQTTPKSTSSNTNTINVKRPSSSSTAISLFGEVDGTSSSAGGGGGFDAFGDDPFAATSTTTKKTTDPFATSTISSGNSFDPFGAPSTPVNNAATARKQLAASSNQPLAQPVFDAFDTPVATSKNNNNNDVFGLSNNNSNTNSASKPARRSSVEILSQDFAGLTYTTGNNNMNTNSTTSAANIFPPAPANTTTNDSAAVTTSTATATAVEEEGFKDPWKTNLVDLDLNKNSLSNITATRRSSLNTNAGPSLDSLIGANPRKSIISAPITAPITNIDPFAAPPRPPMMNTADTISSLGPPMASGNPFAMNPHQNVRGSMTGSMMTPNMMPPMNNNNNGFGGMGNVMGSTMGPATGGNTMMMGVGGPPPMYNGTGGNSGNIRASIIMQSPNVVNQAPKTSLDSLDISAWK
jgi:hypothetical protein